MIHLRRGCRDLTKGDVSIHVCFRRGKVTAMFVQTPHGPQRLPDAVLRDPTAWERVLGATDWIEVVQRARTAGQQ